jgi:hypothetical protein
VGTGSLQISDVMEQDQGTYQCRAENRDDSVDATATLEVHGMHWLMPETVCTLECHMT